MTDIAKKALSMIKEKNIHPKPRWQFLLSSSLVWIFAVVSVLLGSLAVSVALFIINDYDLSILTSLDAGVYEHIVLNLPYFWMVFIAIFSLLAFYNIKHIKGGYRIKAWLILGGSVLSSLAVGAILFFFGAGMMIDDVFARNFPYYNRMVCGRTEFWMNPARGFLAGEIIEVHDIDIFRLKDLNNKRWDVRGKNAIWRHDLSAEKGLKIRMIGKPEGEIFTASQIMPFMGKGQGRMMGGSCMMDERK